MRPARLALLVALLGFGLVAERVGDLPLPVADLVVGLMLAGCGMVAWERTSASRVGSLLTLSGVAWFIGTLFPPARFLHRGPLVQLYLSYPTGRMRRAVVWATVGVAYVYAAVALLDRNELATLVLASLVALTATDVFVRTSGPARKAGKLALACAFAFAGVLALVSIAQLAGWDRERALLLLYDAVIASTGFVLLGGLLVGRWTSATIADLVVDLGELEGAGTLRDRLARALGDPSLVVGYWIPERADYIDDLGHHVEVPAASDPSAVTQIADGSARLAVLVHDAAVLEDPRLVMAVTSAARLAVSNARLQSDIRARVAELAASRRRIVESSDDQRKQLELELRHGAERRLEHAAELLDEARREATPTEEATLVTVAEELSSARAELRDFAQGIHPAVLNEGGLPAALPLLAARTPARVELAVTVERLPPPVEAAVYFVCCEALANVAKHAQAAGASVDVSVRDGQVVAVVADNGGGGADPALGSGLRGLADRVEALGGRLAVESPRHGGTAIIATIPIE
jgi:signal transduction histidine kinase